MCKVEAASGEVKQSALAESIKGKTSITHTRTMHTNIEYIQAKTRRPDFEINIINKL